MVLYAELYFLACDWSVVCSRGLVTGLRLNDNRGKQQFEVSLQQLFSAINKLMKDVRELVSSCLEACLQYMPSVISDVVSLYSPLEFRSVSHYLLHQQAVIMSTLACSRLVLQ